MRLKFNDARNVSISHSPISSWNGFPCLKTPGGSNFESDSFFSQTRFSGGVIKNMLVCITCVTFILDACKVSLLNYLN